MSTAPLSGSMVMAAESHSRHALMFVGLFSFGPGGRRTAGYFRVVAFQASPPEIEAVALDGWVDLAQSRLAATIALTDRRVPLLLAPATMSPCIEEGHP